MTTSNESVFPPASLRALAGEVASLLASRNETVSVAETAAGGLISASILATPGASKIYKGGVTVCSGVSLLSFSCGLSRIHLLTRRTQLYTLESRIAFGGWTPADIENYRGPTPAIVTGLATHVRAQLGSTYTVCESGTAGPTGGTTQNRTP